MNEKIKEINVKNTIYQELIKPYEKEALNTLKELIAIPSVHDESSITSDKPFGQEVENALSYIADKGAKLGFQVDRCDNYVTELTYGDGDKVFDIYAHLDVVPVKEKNWKHHPFSLTIEDGIMYGRGVSDDKGPAIACLYAVKAFTEDTCDFTLRYECIRINRLDKSENIDRLMSLCQHHDYLHRLAAVASCSVNKRSTSVYVFYDSLADLVILL